MLKRLFKKWFKTDSDHIEEYLAQSVYLIDLENRQRDLTRGGYLA